MGMKTLEGELKDECLERLKPGEPFFVLRAQDEFSCDLVEAWILKAARNGVSAAKVAKAQATLNKMREYPTKKVPD